MTSGGAARAAAFSHPAPDSLTYAIGDIHGRPDLMDRLLARIEADLAGNGAHVTMVFLGDYVDRGPDARRVIEGLMSLERAARDQEGWAVIRLKGNHEAMLLGFLDRPHDEASRWFANGGLATLESYGVRAAETAAASYTAIAETRDAFAAAIGPGAAFLHDSPSWTRSGDVIFAHAGAEPRIAPDLQSARALHWGMSAFLERPREDGLWVIHGHWQSDGPMRGPGRIGIDTGAYRTGRLTAVRLQAGEAPRFIST